MEIIVMGRNLTIMALCSYNPRDEDLGYPGDQRSTVHHHQTATLRARRIRHVEVGPKLGASKLQQRRPVGRPAIS